MRLARRPLAPDRDAADRAVAVPSAPALSRRSRRRALCLCDVQRGVDQQGGRAVLPGLTLLKPWTVLLARDGIAMRGGMACAWAARAGHAVEHRAAFQQYRAEECDLPVVRRCPARRCGAEVAAPVRRHRLRGVADPTGRRVAGGIQPKRGRPAGASFGDARS
ncbi:conserved hypothetical protein [Ricinus communis]|uniref:Uncharacterized protein n=1 Tax=Ricinus communis TaxID=3988 RepID=B9TFG4_RICCO|nr:conserved hypothetical protein [Ricinus communis]